MLPGTSSSPTAVGTCFYLLPVYSRVTCIASLINVLSFQIDSPKLVIKFLLQAQGHKEQETNFVLSLMFPLLFNCEVVTSSLLFVDCSVPGSSVGSPCSPRDSQKSPATQFKSINPSCSAFFLV